MAGTARPSVVTTEKHPPTRLASWKPASSSPTPGACGAAAQRLDEEQREPEHQERDRGGQGAERVDLRIRDRGGEPGQLERQGVLIAAHRLARAGHLVPGECEAEEPDAHKRGGDD